MLGHMSTQMVPYDTGKVALHVIACMHIQVCTVVYIGQIRYAVCSVLGEMCSTILGISPGPLAVSATSPGSCAYCSVLANVEQEKT